jgi:hypothetical protein
MNHDPVKKPESLEALTQEFRRSRLIMGLSIVAISLILMVVLPSIIRNAVFRVSMQPETKGLFAILVEVIRGAPIGEPVSYEFEELLPYAPETVSPETSY